MKIKKRNLLTIILSVICAIILVCSVGMIGEIKDKNADAMSGSSVVELNILNDGYESLSGNQIFNIAKVKELFEKLSGRTGAGLQTLHALGIQTSADFRNHNDGKDIVLSLGGQEWFATYLSQNNRGDVILTLWATSSAGIFQYNTYSGDGAYPSNMYGTSSMRATVLNNGGDYAVSSSTLSAQPAIQDSNSQWAIFTMDNVAGSLTEFIEVPNNIPWQHTQNASSTTSVAQNYNNDALDVGGDGAIGSYVNKSGYTNWKNDRLWLVSMAEVGRSGVEGLWQISASQRANQYCWLRSAAYSSVTTGCTADPSGNLIYETGAVTAGSGIVPAFHLNLSAIGYDVSDVEVTYNGAAQTLNDVDEADIGWFRSDAMIPDYIEAPMKDAGVYRVNLSLSPETIAAGFVWMDGTADVKEISFTINKKPLAIHFETDSNGFPVVSFSNPNDIYAVDGTEADSTYPQLSLVYYKQSIGAGSATSSLPNSTGTWVARAVINNDCNYTPDTATYEFTWEVSRSPVAQPIFTSTGRTTAEQPYNGDNQTFIIEGVDETKMTYLPDSNLVSSSLSGTMLTIVVKSAKDYDIKFTLITDGELPYKWAGIADETEAIGQLTLTVKITKVAATVNYEAPVDNNDSLIVYNDWAWGVNTPVKINAIGVGLNGDNLVLSLNWVRGNATSSEGGVALSLVNGSYLLPAITNLGTYTLCIELASSGGDNANYTFAGRYISFRITGQGVDFNGVEWLFKLDGTGAGTPVVGEVVNNTTTVSFPYTGKEYSFLINEDSLPDGLAVRTSEGDRTATNFGTYTTTVTIYSTTETVVYEDTVFTLKYSIEKGEYDIEFVWVYKYSGIEPTEYISAPEFNGKTITLSLVQRVRGTLTALPEELKVTYSGEYSERNLGEYTARATFTTTNPNYNAPTVEPFNWKITPKIINVIWEDDYLYDAEGNEYYTRSIMVADSAYEDQLEYFYSYNGIEYGEGVNALAQIYTLAGDTERLSVTVEVRLKPDAVGSYELNDASGNECRTEFTIGDNKIPATVSVEVRGVYSTATVAINVTGSGMSSSYYIVVYYKAESITNLGEEVENFDAKTADAGTYVAVISLVDGWDEEYSLKPSRVMFEILPMEISIPEISKISFNGYTLDLKEYLSGSYSNYAQYIDIIGTSGRDAGTYTAYLTLTNKNYIWAIPEEGGATATKRSVRAALAAEGLSVSLDRSMLTLPWTINKAQLTANWNLSGKEGAVINSLSAYKDAINEGMIDVDLLVRYYDNDKNMLESVELTGGNSYLVDAILTGEDAKNFEFVNGVGTEKSATAMVEYSIPKSGITAALDAVKNFINKTWLGLPIWAWLLIALALLILLIIIIVVACKRRKSKEEREEIKARKEEEKQRREEERQAQKERLEAERELAKAKQEVELEKIRMQAQMGAGMAGAATMAMQQPVQQQQQPMPQQPVQQVQSIDNNALARIEAEIAQINVKIANQQHMQPQFMPMPMQMPVPQQMPMMSMPPQQMAMMPMPSGGGASGGEFSELRADVRSMREEQRSDREVAALKKEMELEFAKMRADGAYGKSPAQIALPTNLSNGQELPQNGQPVQPNSAEVMGAIMAAFVKNMSVNGYVSPVAEPVQEQQTEAQPTIANATTNYPSDAVITTTTTVDTTKKGNSRESKVDDGRLFDIDGFYDAFEDNK